MDSGGLIYTGPSSSVTFSGAATGARWAATAAGVLNTNGSNPDTYLPGNAAGSASAGGRNIFDTGAWITYTPTVSATTGTITTASATGRYRAVDKTVYFAVSVTVTNNGTGAGLLTATLPPALSAANPGSINYYCIGQLANNNHILLGIINGGATIVDIVDVNGAYPIASGQTAIVTGFYEAA